MKAKFSKLGIFLLGIWMAAAILPGISFGQLNRVDDEAEFFAYLDYAKYPALAAVKAAADASNFDLAKAELLNYMRGRTSVQYLFDALRQREALLAERKVSAGEISTANSNMSHVFNFQAETRDLGPDIAWNQGASEWTSVLNRWGWLPPMAWVYLHTQDEKYAREIIETIWIDWIEDNPLPASRTTSLGQPWRALEVGYRCETMLEIYHLVLGSATMTPQNHYLLLKNMLEHGIYLNDWCNTFNQNNWQVAGCTGLSLLAAIFPEFTAAPTWRNRAFLRIADHLNQDTSDEGWHREYAGGYHINCALDYWLAFELARRNGLPVDPGLSRRHRLMFDVMIRYRFPDREFTGTGDSSAQGAYSRSALGVGVTTYGDGTWRYDAMRPTVAQVGLSGLQFFDRIPSRPPRYESFHDPLAGFAVMRSDSVNTRTNPFSQMVFLDANRDAIAHRHEDNGQVVFFAYNRYLFADGGSWLYNTPEHTTLTKARSHNVVLPGDNFIGYGAGAISEFEATPGFDHALLSMDGGAVGKWQRQVLYVRPEYVVVVDRVEAAGTHRQYWQFPTGSNLSLDPASREFKTSFATNYLNTQGTVRAMPLHPEEILDAQFEQGQQVNLKNQRGWFTFTGNPAMRETILLAQYPNTQNPGATLTAIDPLGKSRAQACGFSLELRQNTTTTRDVILMNHEPVAVPTLFGLYGTNARMAYLRHGSDGAPARLMIRHGSSFTQQGKALFSSPQPVADLEAQFLGSVLALRSNPSTATVTLHAPHAQQATHNGAPVAFTRSGEFVTIHFGRQADRLALDPESPFRTWVGAANLLRVRATDGAGQVDARSSHTITLDSPAPGLVFSPDNFLTTGNDISLLRGEGRFWFRADTPGKTSITATAEGLAPASLENILIQPIPAQANGWGRYE